MFMIYGQRYITTWNLILQISLLPLNIELTHCKTTQHYLIIYVNWYKRMKDIWIRSLLLGYYNKYMLVALVLQCRICVVVKYYILYLDMNQFRQDRSQWFVYMTNCITITVPLLCKVLCNYTCTIGNELHKIILLQWVGALSLGVNLWSVPMYTEAMK